MPSAGTCSAVACPCFACYLLVWLMLLWGLDSSSVLITIQCSVYILLHLISCRDASCMRYSSDTGVSALCIGIGDIFIC